MLVQVQNIRKEYLLGKKTIPVLRSIDLQVDEGEFVSIMGPSGSGKSTLLHILGGLDTPDSGSYLFNGKNMLFLSDSERSWIRANQIGFVFQTFDLLSELNVVENIRLPFFYNRFDPTLQKELVDQAIEKVGLTHRRNHRPVELSGGEMQRVAFARALVVNPKLILADEPTGNLDSSNSSEILSIFRELHCDDTTIIMVTHDQKVADLSQKTYEILDGILI